MKVLKSSTYSLKLHFILPAMHYSVGVFFVITDSYKPLLV